MGQMFYNSSLPLHKLLFTLTAAFAGENLFGVLCSVLFILMPRVVEVEQKNIVKANIDVIFCLILGFLVFINYELGLFNLVCSEDPLSLFIVCEYSLFSNYFWKKYLPQCVFLMLCVIDEFGVCCLNAQCPPQAYIFINLIFRLW